MAAYTITAGDVQKDVTNANRTTGVAGEDLVAGLVVYIDSADNNEIKKCDNTTLAKAAAVGITVNDAGSGQEVSYDPSGTITVGSAFAAGDVGKILVVSSSPSKMENWEDLTTGDYITLLGYVASTTTMVLDIQQTGLTLP